ncbi:hypothetical protein JQX13_41605 [Archangium violaceum]|uniref:hypothetical protein n=1 Tax=Archangium violaceum TaxID=83451 RepID=UPI00193C02D6|nr:hypothetical protein [Archangium violaceum]QRK06527.1 hypothetical protein JQX13_41605 [Archangium violaceum]
MKHPLLDELVARMRAARAAGDANQPSEEQLRLHRELAESCPAFVPNLMELARLLRLDDNPPSDSTSEAVEVELRQLLEQAVLASGRSAPALVELAYFLDIFHDSPPEAETLFEEGARKALGTLEEAWAGLISYWSSKRTRESLAKALQLGETAEKLFPESERIGHELRFARELAVADGILPPGWPHLR